MSIKSYKFVFFIGLLSFPLVLGNIYLDYVFDIIYLIAFFFTLSNKNLILFNKDYKKHMRYIYFYLLLLFISYIRSNEFSFFKILNLVSFTLFVLAYLSVIINENNKNNKNNKNLIDNFTSYIMTPFVWWTLLNLICWMLNLKTGHKELTENSIGNAVILSNFGITIERVNFLFSKGINGYAVLLGSFFTYYSSIIFLYKKWSMTNILSFLILLISILLTDARSALSFPLIISLIIYLIFILKLKIILKFGALLFIAIPIIIVSGVPLLSEIEFFSQFSRNETDFFTLNGRLFIWLFALDEFLNFKFIHFIGYGFGGQVTSGASQNWAFLFGAYLEPDTVHPHNSILSIIFDLGYLGIITVLAILNQVSKKLFIMYQHNQKEILTLFSMLLYFIFISVTESFLTDLYMNGLYVFLTYFIFIIASGKEENKTLNNNNI